MQATRTSKVSRRFYIDHADDHAVIRAVPVAVGHSSRPSTHQTAIAEQTGTSTPTNERRLSRLVQTAIRRSHRKHG